MKSSDEQRLEHILDYCQDIEDSLDRFGRDLDVFVADRDFYNSVSMSLLQIGELTKRLAPETMALTGEDISWNAIKGMRDHFAHGYGEMDSEIILLTAVNDIPVLKKKLEELKNSLSA